MDDIDDWGPETRPHSIRYLMADFSCEYFARLSWKKRRLQQKQSSKLFDPFCIFPQITQADP